MLPKLFGTFLRWIAFVVILSTLSIATTPRILLFENNISSFYMGKVPLDHSIVRGFTLVNNTDKNTSIAFVSQNEEMLKVDFTHQCDHLLEANESCVMYVKQLSSDAVGTLSERVNLSFSDASFSNITLEFNATVDSKLDAGFLKTDSSRFSRYVYEKNPYSESILYLQSVTEVNTTSPITNIVLSNVQSGSVYIYAMGFEGGESEQFEIVDTNNSCKNVLLAKDKNCTIPVRLKGVERVACVHYETNLMIYSDAKNTPFTKELFGSSNDGNCSHPYHGHEDHMMGACFIATATYGSYFHPYVKILRDFRDSYLLTNQIGTEFVSFYYKNSPPIADYISHKPILKFLVSLFLTPIVFLIGYPLYAIGFIFGFVLFVRKRQYINIGYFQSIVTKK